ncbi:hypothetical protein EV360DRAFT_58390 [Lentinula raphanica]|nr:hypothetical protein EV360DRAFT_58390 [Lentinula raphanica]
MKALILTDPRAFQSIHDIHDELCSQLTDGKAAQNTLRKRLTAQRWISLAYVCNDLMVFPEDLELELHYATSLSESGITKRDMASALVDWRVNDIQEQNEFIWPFFTTVDIPQPSAPWAQLPPSNRSTVYHPLSSHDRNRLLDEIGQTLDRHAAYGVGHIHRTLTQALQDNEEGLNALYKALNRRVQIALLYVCIDVGRVPLGDVHKVDLIEALISWVSHQPHSIPVYNPRLLASDKA